MMVNNKFDIFKFNIGKEPTLEPIFKQNADKLCKLKIVKTNALSFFIYGFSAKLLFKA